MSPAHKRLKLSSLRNDHKRNTNTIVESHKLNDMIVDEDFASEIVERKALSVPYHREPYRKQFDSIDRLAQLFKRDKG